MRFCAVSAVILLSGLTFLHTACAQDTYSPLPSTSAGQSSPVTAELDGDSTDGMETVVGMPNGTVQALKADGSVMWSTALPNYGCASSTSTDKLYSSPIIANLYGDSRPFIVIGYGGYRGKPCDGGVAALRASDGSFEWVFSIKKWARTRGYTAFRNAVVGTPAAADVDGDGKLEVGFGAFDRNVYLLNSNGTVRWYYNAADTVFSSPVFLDVDGDKRLEMIIGTDISQNTRLNPPTPNGGYLYALKAGMKVRKPATRYMFRDPTFQAWRSEFNQVMQSSPVAADLIPESEGLEVVVGSGCFFPQSAGDRNGKWYRVVSVKTGAVLKTLNVTACTPSPAGVGDLDGDGSLDVVVAVSGDPSTGGDGRSHLIAWNPALDKVMWDITPRLGGRTDRFGGHYNRAPVVTDLDGNGIAEVVINYANGVVVVDGPSGSVVSCSDAPCSREIFRTDDLVQGRPLVADLNGDGALELIVSGKIGRSGSLVRWSGPFNLGE